MDRKAFAKHFQTKLEEAGLKLPVKTVEKAVSLFGETIMDQMLKGHDVSIFGFAKFSVTERAERNGMNPSTLEKMIIPKRKTIHFKLSTTYKKLLNY